MTDQNPYEQLGVTEDASFDEIQDAKGRLIQQNSGDQKLVESVEAAYDAVIMDRLRMRQEGKIKVPERIRFPEKERLSEAPTNFPTASVNQSPQWLQRMLDTPTAGEMLWPGVCLLLLSGMTIFSSAQEIQSTLPLVLALGFGCNIYFLNRKEQQFGRAFLLTLAGLLVGIGLGTILGNLLDVQTNLGLSLDRFATVVTFFFFWLISSFLR
ncbi:MAG: CPP1-like family protein [Coleofasciculaceae cyanobacterium]